MVFFIKLKLRVLHISRKRSATPVLAYLIFQALCMIVTSVLIILLLVKQDAVTGICQRMDNQNQGVAIRVKIQRERVFLMLRSTVVLPPLSFLPSSLAIPNFTISWSIIFIPSFPQLFLISAPDQLE